MFFFFDVRKVEIFFFFFSSRRRHTRYWRDWSSDVCSSGLDADGRTLRLTIDLQANFALNQPLSPFAVAAFELLDRDDPAYALDMVSVVEATLDDPRPIVNAQRHRARGEAINEMKMDGIEYDERMELLEEITHPKPLEELLTA